MAVLRKHADEWEMRGLRSQGIIDVVANVQGILGVAVSENFQEPFRVRFWQFNILYGDYTCQKCATFAPVQRVVQFLARSACEDSQLGATSQRSHRGRRQ